MLTQINFSFYLFSIKDFNEMVRYNIDLYNYNNTYLCIQCIIIVGLGHFRLHFCINNSNTYFELYKYMH